MKKKISQQEWEQAWLNYFKMKNLNWWQKLKIKLGSRCPKCYSKLDYDHIGYKCDKGYCHNCKWRSDRGKK